MPIWTQEVVKLCSYRTLSSFSNNKTPCNTHQANEMVVNLLLNHFMTISLLLYSNTKAKNRLLCAKPTYSF